MQIYLKPNNARARPRPNFELAPVLLKLDFLFELANPLQRDNAGAESASKRGEQGSMFTMLIQTAINLESSPAYAGLYHTAPSD